MKAKAVFGLGWFWGAMVCLQVFGQTAPETVSPTRGPLVIVETIDGRVEAKSMTPFKLEPKAWVAFKVKETLAQGTPVKKGAQVLAFDDQDISAKLQESKYEFDLAKVGLDQSASDLSFFQKVRPLDEMLAERTWQQTHDDTDYYLNIQKPLAERQAKKGLESSQYQVEYAQEEIDQLLKMYKADDLTEESEKIVLKRAERSLDQSKFYLESAELNTKRQLEVDIPRAVKDRETGLTRADIEHERKKLEMPREAQRKELEFAKLKFAFEKKQKDYQELMEDAQLMSLKAPADGVVYHGQSRRGVWTKGGTASSRIIEPGDAVTAGSIVFTIVDLSSLQLRCDLDQKTRMSIEPSAKCVAIFDSQPGTKYQGTISSIGDFPLDDGKYDCLIQLKEFPKGIVPGMSCKVKIVTYQNDRAVMVPKTCVFSDDGGITQYVYVQNGEKSERKTVVAIRENGDQLEVTEGLTESDKVLKTKPK